jgi:hypothetical protein
MVAADDRGLCAGGDIVAIYHAVRDNSSDQYVTPIS